jgi:hypothetical protein
MRAHPRTHRLLRLAVLVGTALVLPGCGGGVTDPDPNPSSQPTISKIIEQGWALEPLEAAFIDLEIVGGGGTLDATVEWTFASDDVDIYVTAVTCTLEMVATERCAYKAKAESETAKPERVSFSVSVGDKYRFWVVNFGPQRESGTFVATLTR